MFFFSFTEHGEFLALDLGGTNLRVLLITLKEGIVTDEVRSLIMNNKYYPIEICRVHLIQSLVLPVAMYLKSIYSLS